jgi:SAM-dependent methyltransferase/spore maturation protein CgeB
MHDDHHNDTAQGSASNPWPDRVNEAYYDGMGSAFGQKTRERINWMCSQARGSRVLDVGCSQGIASILMAREGMSVTGVDIFAPVVEYALAERDKEIKSVRDRLVFLCADLATIQEGLFDTVIMGEVIEHQTNPVRFIRQGAARVAPGGRMVITVPFGLHPWPDHKSTIFPGDVATALSGEFAFELLEVADGYIRAVADRCDAAQAGGPPPTLLRATEQGALETQKKFYQVNADREAMAKAKAGIEAQLVARQESLATLEKLRTGLERDLALKAQALAYAEANIATTREQAADQTRLIGEQTSATVRQAERIAELIQEGAVHKALLGELQRTLETAKRELESVRQAGERLAAEHREAQQRIGQLEQDKHAASTRAQELRKQLEEVRREAAIAQHKRQGHYAHLQAEREYTTELVAFARQLHEDNERYRNSVALAIGRAFLGLTSVRGVLGFPRALWAAWRSYRQREGGAAAVDPIKLPALKPVSLPPKPHGGAGGTSGSMPEPTATGPVTHDQHRKDLSITGWKQDQLPEAIPVMSVLDEFSRSCFAPQASLIEPRPDNWEGLLETSKPRFLLVESSWKGNYGSWQYRVANYANPPGNELAEMVDGFRARNIPTVFWNKEDPVHFTNFIDSASRFDVVLTTAAEAVPLYEERTSARVGVLQFAAEESLHNPIDSARRNDKVCFAGSFYANRFHERREDQLMLLDAASSFDFDIFDRNHQPSAATRSDFAFPERFDRFVRGSLPYKAIGRAYRDYRVFLNVNSVIDSPTMFSRRVFELLACGTPVVSTWSLGTETTFGNDLVWHVRNREEAEEAIRILMTDDREWRRRSLAGIRAVLSAHTYLHRFRHICQMLGIEKQGASPFEEVLVAAEVATTAEAVAVLDSFNRQAMAPSTRKRLLLVASPRIEIPHADAPVEVVSASDVNLSDVIARTPLNQQNMFAVMSPSAVYGRHYLQDLLHAARYSGAAVVGKAKDVLETGQYMRDVPLDPHALVMNVGKLSVQSIKDMLRGELTAASCEHVRTYASDSANYARMDVIAEPGKAEAVLREIEI